MGTGEPLKPVNIFCSYARADEKHFDDLRKQWGSLLRQGLITLHSSQEVPPGAVSHLAIERMIKDASLILLLMSTDFLDSDECYNRDMRLAIQAMQTTGTPIIPVYLRSCDWSDTPLAPLKYLPKDGRPVTHWGSHEDAFFAIVQDLRPLIEQARQQQTASPQEVHVDITRVNADSPACFIEYFVGEDRFPHRFPNESDFVQNRVYLSRDYAEKMEHHLHAKRRAVIVGLAAAGKTVLALAYARELHDLHHYRIAYKDVSMPHADGGQQWYEVMRAPHRENTLYILDNCHLAEEEVTIFCTLWNSNPPLQAQCILLSRAEPQQLQSLLKQQDDEHGYEYLNYLELWRDEIVHMQSELTYMEILKHYFNAYQQQNAHFYEDPMHDDLLTLKKQHARSLVISHFLLVAWKKRGGFLSKVRQEDIYQSVYERYLDDRYANAVHVLPMLCALQTFEIPVHRSFIEALPHQQEVAYLLRNDLISDRRVELHGRLYTLAMHPEEARLIFATSLTDNGAVTPKAIEDGLFSALRTYLLTMPKNYLEVYARLCRYRARAILQRLLTDAQLQEQAERQFVRGQLISDESIGTISKIVEYMRQVHYDAAQINRFIDALDIDQIIQHAMTQKKSSPQQLFWLLRSLQKISPPAAARFLESFTPALLAQLCLQQKPAIALISQFSKVLPQAWQGLLQHIGAEELAAIYNRSPLGAVGTFLHFHYAHPVVQQSYPLFAETFLRGKLVRAPLSELGKYLHRLRAIPTHGTTLARAAVKLLATVDLSERISTTDLEPFALLLHEIIGLAPNQAAPFLLPLHIPQITHAALENSGLRGIQLLIHNVGHIDANILPSIHQQLLTLSLQEKLVTTPLFDCSYFLWNVYSWLDPQLAQDYCMLIDAQHSNQLLAETPLDQLCHFLLNLYSLSGQASLQIFSEPIVEERLQQAWELETGFATVLLGLLSLTRPQQRHLSPLQTQVQLHQLEKWLQWPTEQQAYQLALSIHGLRTWDEQAAQQLLRQYLPYPRAMRILQHGRTSARTPRAIALVEGEQRWLTETWRSFS